MKAQLDEWTATLEEIIARKDQALEQQQRLLIELS